MTAFEFNYQIINLNDKLHRFALRLTTNSEDAKDLLQETFYKALSNRDKFRDNTNIQAWAYAIMRNTFINNYLKKKRDLKTFDHKKELGRLKLIQDRITTDTESKVYLNDIDKNISHLDKELRLPFKMFVEGYKYREIADKLNLKLGTVKSRIFFSRKKLMEKLYDYAA